VNGPNKGLRHTEASFGGLRTDFKAVLALVISMKWFVLVSAWSDTNMQFGRIHFA
jgi:hypothetical protein